MLNTKILCEYDKIDDTGVFEKKQYEETKGPITNQYLLLSVNLVENTKMLVSFRATSRTQNS